MEQGVGRGSYRNIECWNNYSLTYDSETVILCVNDINFHIVVIYDYNWCLNKKCTFHMYMKVYKPIHDDLPFELWIGRISGLERHHSYHTFELELHLQKWVLIVVDLCT